MPYSINLRADHPSASRIEELWERASCLENVPSMQNLGYPPHITLAVSDSKSPIDSEDLETVFSTIHSFEVVFDGLGMFANSEHIILWAKPASSEVLNAIHLRVHSQCIIPSCRVNYIPESWQPHCSVATKIPLSKHEDVQREILAGFTPFAVYFNVVDIVEFPPIAVSFEKHLKPPCL